MRSDGYALGIDLGGSSIKAVVITPAGETLRRENLPFDAAEAMDWAAKIRGLIQEFSEEQHARPGSIGLSAPGFADPSGRCIANLPGRLHGLEGLNWTEYLATETPVPVLNDAQAALVGEAWIGAAKGFRHVIMLTLGTGVGGAAIVDGNLLHGRTGKAGHFGHACLDPEGAPDICGMPGSLELMIGNCTIGERSGGRFATTHELIAACLAEDAEAGVIWLKSVRQLACAVASFCNILDPEAVVIGGGIARAGQALFEPLEKFVRQYEWQTGGYQVKLLPAELGEFAGAIGAARRSLAD